MKKYRFRIYIALIVFFALVTFLFVYVLGLGAYSVISTSEVDKTRYWFLALSYRVLTYILLPIIIGLGFKTLAKSRKKLRNIFSKIYEYHFTLISITSAIYLVLALDVLSDVTIFNTSDAFLSVIGLVFLKLFNTKIEVDR